MVKYTAYNSGIIRDANGKLVGWLDRESLVLTVTGIIRPFFGVVTDEEAFDLINQIIVKKEES